MEKIKKMGKRTNKFITIEGIEGVGKSTCVNFLKTYLQQRALDFIVTREPGGTPIAEEIRAVLLAHHQETMVADTEVLLFFAGRAQHIATVIKPALNAGKYVICDRFTDASYAYQAAGRGITKERIDILAQWVHADLQPDLTCLLVAPVKIALSRAKGRSAPDRIELEQENFFSRVQDAYLRRAEAFPERYRIIDASRAPNKVQDELKKIFDNCLV